MIVKYKIEIVIVNINDPFFLPPFSILPANIINKNKLPTYYRPNVSVINLILYILFLSDKKKRSFFLTTLNYLYTFVIQRNNIENATENSL